MRSILTLVKVEAEPSNAVKAESKYVDLHDGGLINFEVIEADRGLKMKTAVTDRVCDSIILLEPEFIVGKKVMSLREDCRWFTVEMSASDGYRSQLIVYLEGAGESTGIAFPIVADGRMRKYAVDLEPLFQRLRWDSSSSVARIGFIPSEKQGVEIEIRSMAFGSLPAGQPYISLVGVSTIPEVPRVGQEVKVRLEFMNMSEKPTRDLSIKVGTDTLKMAEMQPGELSTQVVSRTFQDPGLTELEISVVGGDTWHVNLPIYVSTEDDSYVPEPKIANTDYLIGAHYFPGWKQGAHGRSDDMGWTKIAPYPEKQPLLGWYDECDPGVTDWEIKWALEYGISFFVYCWYGTPEQTGAGDSLANLTHAIHEGLFNARYNEQFKFAINWCLHWGVESQDEIINTLFPYWMDNYFTKPYYLTIDNKPVLFIYDTSNLIRDLGGMSQVRVVLDEMRQKAKESGFDGLYIMGHHWGWDASGAYQVKNSGFDSRFAYINWPRWTESYRTTRPTVEEAIENQKANIQAWGSFNIPYIPTISALWDPMPWYSSDRGGFDDMLRWHISPEEYREVASWTKEWMDSEPEGSLASKVLLLDNWNEFGEGHYIAPHREYGFGYLDVIRDIFTTEEKEHLDIAPDEIGLGPYNTLYTEKLEHRVFKYPALPTKKSK